MQVKNFEDLEIWKDARALTRGSEIRKKFRAPRSNPAGNSLHNVKHRRGI